MSRENVKVTFPKYAFVVVWLYYVEELDKGITDGCLSSVRNLTHPWLEAPTRSFTIIGGYNV